MADLALGWVGQRHASIHRHHIGPDAHGDVLLPGAAGGAVVGTAKGGRKGEHHAYLASNPIASCKKAILVFLCLSAWHSFIFLVPSYGLRCGNWMRLRDV
jgi:hypothetical protein